MPVAVSASLALALPSPAASQTQAQQSRAEQLAEFLTVAPMCERLGMALESDFAAKAEAATRGETSTWQASPGVVERVMKEAIAREGAIFGTDLKAASDGARTDSQLKGLKMIFVRYGRKCMAAAADPTFSRLIHQPSGYDLESSATAAADALLEAGGLASWQTPEIQARGDLMTAAGTCRSKIGPARSDAIVKQYGQSEDARVRTYFLHAFDEGLADPTTIATLAGCNRAIARLRAKAGSGVSLGYPKAKRP